MRAITHLVPRTTAAPSVSRYEVFTTGSSCGNAPTAPVAGTGSDPTTDSTSSPLSTSTPPTVDRSTSPVGFRPSRHTPGFHEVRRDHETVGVIMRRATGFDVYARGSVDVVARKHTVTAAKQFARAYFSEAPDA